MPTVMESEGLLLQLRWQILPLEPYRFFLMMTSF